MKVKALTYNQLQTLCWTEDNRLQAVKDNQMGAYYNYDASGERNLKLTGAVVQMSQNGVPYDYVMLESPTLYASGLITINERGYTKHYFEENKRVCSNIGGGFRDAGYDIMEPIELITPFVDQWTNAKEGIFKTFEQCIKSPVDLENTNDKIVKVMKDHEKDRNEEEYQFYYTNDHLGSSTYITDQDGNITQTLAYLPYGEDWIDLDNQPPYLTPYKFNGKEKDQETGYNYFGARYLNNDLSIWLSVDPLSDKYPSTSSYAYCRNNPVILIDPNGMNDDGWQINLKENTVTKVNHLGGDKQQHVSFMGGTKDVSTYDMSTSEFISKNKKLGLEVSDNTNMNTNNITSELGSQITGIGLSLSSDILEDNTLKNPKLNLAGKLLGKGLFGIGIALDTKNTINVLNSDMSNSSKLYETGKTATPYALTFLFGSTIGGLSAPAIIAADMAWEGMKQIYSNIDNWGRNLPNQIINSH